MPGVCLILGCCLPADHAADPKLRYVVWPRAWRVTESHRKNVSLIIRVLSLMLYKVELSPSLLMGDLDTLRTPARRSSGKGGPCSISP